MMNTSTTVQVADSMVRAAASADHIERSEQTIDDVLAPLSWLSSGERQALVQELRFQLQEQSFARAVRTAQQQCNEWLPTTLPMDRRARLLVAAAVLRAFHDSDFDTNRRDAWRAIGTVLKGAADQLDRHPRMVLGMRYRSGADVALAALAQLFNVSERQVLGYHSDALDALAGALEGGMRKRPG